MFAEAKSIWQEIAISKKKDDPPVKGTPKGDKSDKGGKGKF